MATAVAAPPTFTTSSFGGDITAIQSLRPSATVSTMYLETTATWAELSLESPPAIAIDMLTSSALANLSQPAIYSLEPTVPAATSGTQVLLLPSQVA